MHNVFVVLFDKLNRIFSPKIGPIYCLFGLVWFGWVGLPCCSFVFMRAACVCGLMPVKWFDSHQNCLVFVIKLIKTSLHETKHRHRHSLIHIISRRHHWRRCQFCPNCRTRALKIIYDEPEHRVRTVIIEEKEEKKLNYMQHTKQSINYLTAVKKNNNKLPASCFIGTTYVQARYCTMICLTENIKTLLHFDCLKFHIFHFRFFLLLL